MRFIKTKENGLEENYLELHYDELDDETREYISRIDKTTAHIEGTCDNMRVTVPVSEVLYFESVDRKTFAYTENRTVEFRESLRNLLDNFGDIGFVRISKSAVVCWTSSIRSLLGIQLQNWNHRSAIISLREAGK